METLDPFAVVLWMFAVPLGAVVGSFLNVCIWRLPRPGLAISRPARSHCPSCGNSIPWHDNVPVFSWLVLAGRCRSCKAPISVRYLLVESLTAMLFFVIAVRCFQDGDYAWAEFVVLTVLTSSLIVASVIDVDLRILPDEITLGGMMLVPPVALLVPGLHTQPPDTFVWRSLSASQGALSTIHGYLPSFLTQPSGAAVVAFLVGALGFVTGLYGFRLYWRSAHPTVANRLRDGLLGGVLLGSVAAIVWLLAVDPGWILSPRIVSFASALFGMAVGAGLVLAVGIAGTFVFRKEAMGFGDVKLMGLLGGAAGWTGVLSGFALACLLGSIVGVWRLAVLRTRYIWFGPFLATGCLVVILFPTAVARALDWYLALFQ